MRTALALAPLLLALCTAACQGGAPMVGDAETILAEAERRLAAGDYQGCRDLLLSRDESELPRALQPRYEVALARSHLQLGEPGETFAVLRDFADDHPHSDLRDQVIELQFRAGSTLADSDGGFLFFWSDRRLGKSCLEHLITRYPDSVHLADALRILGELEFAAGNHAAAEERFRDLLRRRPESEWVPLARFRYAMSIVEALNGPEYDLARMRVATNELRDFLADPPENPEFVQAAEEALQRLLSWQAERHLIIARFYHTVENRAGRIWHLQRAAAPEFAATDAAAEARGILRELGEEPGT